MSPDARWERIEALFDEALDRAPVERAAWLREAAGDDAGVRDEVARMLAAHEGREGILDRGLHRPAAEELMERLRGALGQRYAIDGVLGQGGMAVVFLATERKHGRRVVLKVMRPEAAAAFGPNRFLREVRIAAQLAHPHIVGLIDSGEAAGLLFYVMPYVEGETLRARLRDRPQLDVGEAVALLRDVAGALAYAHRAGVVHRDLKPENILCVGDRAGAHAFLMDFGIAKVLSATDGERMTLSGIAIGTPAYMAPEQASAGEYVDHRADIYAFGVVAYEMLTGEASSRPGVVRRPLAAARPDVPHDLAALVETCLERNRLLRVQSADDIGTRLDALADTPVAGRRSMPPRGRRLAWGLAAVGVAAAAVAAFAVLRPTSRPAAGLAMPIAVAALDNQTGDSSLTTWGRLAGDWVTQGLQETGLVTVVPWPTALRAWERFEAERSGGGRVDPLAVMRAETGAGTIVTGAYYLVGNRLRFQMEVSDAASGRLLGASQPVTVAADSPHDAVEPLRDRVMGAIAVHTDERLANLPGLMERPPTYEAYRAFDRGLRLYLDQSYGTAAIAFREAYGLDTTFVVPLFYAALGYWNSGEIAAADSLLGALRARRSVLTEYHDLMLQYLEASLVSDGETALRAIRRATQVAPDTRAGYNLALTALDANRPREALAALERLNPDHGTLRGWSSYWTQLTHALHMQGLHDRELLATWEMQERFPDRRVAHVLEARALAALGRTAAIDSLLRSISALPPNTYWSQAAAMVVAAEELAAHGHPEAASPLWDQAVSWLANQLARDPSSRPHRYWMGTALHDASRPDDAAPYFSSLADDYPDDQEFRGLAALVIARAGDGAAARRRLGEPAAHDRGRHTAFRARLAAIAGDHDHAVSLLSEALRQGIGSFPWLHASARPELSLLAADPTYQRLMAGDADR